MKLLIVEDDPIARALLTMHLNDYGELIITNDGQKGLEAFKKSIADKEHFDVIFLDIMMPNVDGHEVLETVRKLEKSSHIDGTKGVKIIMCSALDDSTNVIKAFRNQCEGYVTKPIKKEDIDKQLRKFGLLE